MKIRGYQVGDIKADAAMTSDIVMRSDLSFDRINDAVEIERRIMDVHPGMNRKYTPFQYDPVTGDPLCGGRYVFDTWENVQNYFRWTLEEFEVEPGVKFWDRSIFSKVDKHIWKVVGAHDFTHVETHGVNRLERWRYTADADQARRMLDHLWTVLRERASREKLGTAWLLDQPDEKQVAILVTGRTALLDSDMAAVSASVEKLAAMPSLGVILPAELGLTKVFDRTSPVFSTWLPLSRQQHGAPVAHPSYPAWPLPSVSPQVV
jgi:hypothetical protein